MAEAAEALDAMPVGEDYDAHYRRIVRLVPKMPTAGRARCQGLALVWALKRWVPDAVPGAFAALRSESALVCGSDVGAQQVPAAVTEWVAAGLARPDVAAAELREKSRPVAAEPTSGGRDAKPYITLSIGDKPIRALVDTGSATFLAIDRPTAAELGVRLYETGEKVTACMTCEPTPVALGWIDRMQLGPYDLRNVPVDVSRDHAEAAVVGSALLWRVGGLAIGGGADGQFSLFFGPGAKCSKPMRALLGAQGRVFVHADLARFGGAEVLMFDSGLAADYGLWSELVPTIPTDWSLVRQGDHEAVYSVPEMPGQGGAAPATRMLWRFVLGGPQPAIPGAVGWVSHGAFAPQPVCLRFEQPMLSVGH